MDDFQKSYRKCADYDSSCKLEGTEVRCYSSKQFEKQHEKGGYLLSGVLGKGKGEPIGRFYVDNREYAYSGCRYRKFLYEPAGYIRCEDDTYLVLLKYRVRKFLLMLFLLALFLGLLFLVLQMYLKKGPDLEPGTRDFKAATKLPDDYGSTRIIIPAFQPLYVVEQETAVKTVLWNPDKNQVYFEFQIVLDDTQEVLYESRLVPPGQAVYELQLKRGLPQGVYPITVRVTTYDLKAYEEKMNGGEVKTMLNVVKK